MWTGIVAAAMGVALAAACGLRVFLPMFVAGLAARLGFVELGGVPWLTSNEALVALGVATAVEIGAYYIPWLDNLLDALATPASIVAGTLLAAAALTDVDPWFRWIFAAIAGGGAAGLVQVSTVTARAASTATTGGLLNPIFSTAETVGALAFVALALGGLAFVVIFVAALPIVALWFVRRTRRRGVPTT